MYFCNTMIINYYNNNNNNISLHKLFPDPSLTVPKKENLRKMYPEKKTWQTRQTCWAIIITNFTNFINIEHFPSFSSLPISPIQHWAVHKHRSASYQNSIDKAANHLIILYRMKQTLLNIINLNSSFANQFRIYNYSVCPDYYYEHRV